MYIIGLSPMHIGKIFFYDSVLENIKLSEEHYLVFIHEDAV